MSSIIITGANRGIGLGLVREVLNDSSYGAIYATTIEVEKAKVRTLSFGLDSLFYK